jgi:hypothetical protein
MELQENINNTVTNEDDTCDPTIYRTSFEDMLLRTKNDILNFSFMLNSLLFKKIYIMCVKINIHNWNNELYLIFSIEASISTISTWLCSLFKTLA